MKTLEKRLFHLFNRADVAAARSLIPSSVACPRVGQVRATIADPDGAEHEVFLELSAHRRGGMTLESRCTTPAGRSGRPCAALAAVLLEVDRRGLLKGIHDQTPVTLDIQAEEASADDDTTMVETTEVDEVDERAAADEREAAGRGTGGRSAAVTRGAAVPRGSQRMPAWAAELEERRRLVEPAGMGW